MVTHESTFTPGLGALSLALAASSLSVAEQVGSSVGDFSGVQGQGGWTYGYYDRTADPDNQYTAAEFEAFPAHYWTGTLWDWPDGNPPWTQLRAHSGHPNGAPWAPDHWAVRRWTSTQTGPLSVCGRFAKIDPGGGNGTTCRVIVDGKERFTATIAFNDTVGVTFEFDVDVVPGTTIDFAVDALGTNGSRNTLNDSSRLSAAIFTPCRADIDGSGGADFNDLLAILGAWGPCDGCPEDLRCDGGVDFEDILKVLTAWGPCTP